MVFRVRVKLSLLIVDGSWRNEIILKQIILKCKYIIIIKM